LDLNPQAVAGLSTIDEDRAGQRHRAAAWPIGTQLLQFLDRAARPKLAMGVRHSFDNDGIAGVDHQARQLGIVEPSPLRRFQRRRQDVHVTGVLGGRHDHELLRARNRRRGLLRHGSGNGERNDGHGHRKDVL
jgi:hypothetical protein